MITDYAAYTCEGDSVTLYRLYGMGPLVEIPAIIDGKPVQRYADHLFAREMSVMCPVQNLSLAAFDSERWIKVPAEQYPSSLPEMEERALCQDRVEMISIPEGAVQIGNYAFYGLYRLREIRFPSSMQRIGWGMFNGCGKIERLIFHLPDDDSFSKMSGKRAGLKQSDPAAVIMAPGGKQASGQRASGQRDSGQGDGGQRDSGQRENHTGKELSEKELTPPIMKEVLDALSGEVDAIVMRGEQEVYRLRFPEYYEEGKENTPARIIEIIYHGTGHQYRNCFLSRVLQFERYDDIFPLAAAQESIQTNVPLILSRLRSGPRPNGKALERYLNYLRSNNEAVTELILADKEFDPVPTWMMLDDYEYFTSTDIDVSIRGASESGCTAAVSCLMDIRNRRFTVKKHSRYEL